jgi:hypothetical protein
VLPTAFRDDDRNPFLSLHHEMNRLFDESTDRPCIGSPIGTADP